MSTKTLMGILVLSITGFYASIALGAERTTPPAHMTDVATCNDGTIYSSLSGNHRGACSGHKGVKAWSDGSPVKTRKGRKGSYRKASADASDTVSILDLSGPDAPESEFPTVVSKGKL